VAAGLPAAAEHALVSLLALNGLRVSEATGGDIQALGSERGHRTLVITRKGGKVVTIPLAPRTARAIDLAIGERREGRAEPSHHWSRHAPDLAPAALVAPGASRVPGPEVPAAASSPVSSAARRRAAVPQTWPARIAALGRWRLLTWPWSTAGGIHTRNHRPGSSLQAPGSG